MARARLDQSLTASVLDRLLDDEPTNTHEAPRNRGQLLRDLKESVCRDLENLLNTRARSLMVPAAFKELKHSLVNYGLPDFTGAPTGSARDREGMARAIQAVLRQHEPRFKKVEVKLLDNSEPLDRTLRFRIDALLYAEPTPEPVVFDSTLRPATGDFEVRGAGG